MTLWLRSGSGTVVLAALDQVVLEGVQVVLDGYAVELGGAVVDVLFVLSSKNAVELHFFEGVELWGVDHLDVFEVQGYFFFLPHSFQLFLSADDVAVLELALQLFLVVLLRDDLELACLGVLVIEVSVGVIEDGGLLELLSEVEVVVAGDDLLVDGLGEISDALLLSFQVGFQLVVLGDELPDAVILDEFQGVLHVLEAVLEAPGLVAELRGLVGGGLLDGEAGPVHGVLSVVLAIHTSYAILSK